MGVFIPGGHLPCHVHRPVYLLQVHPRQRHYRADVDGRYFSGAATVAAPHRSVAPAPWTAAEDGAEAAPSCDRGRAELAHVRRVGSEVVRGSAFKADMFVEKPRRKAMGVPTCPCSGARSPATSCTRSPVLIGRPTSVVATPSGIYSVQC